MATAKTDLKERRDEQEQLFKEICQLALAANLSDIGKEALPHLSQKRSPSSPWSRL